jgi:hypothetical protein
LARPETMFQAATMPETIPSENPGCQFFPCYCGVMGGRDCCFLATIVVFIFALLYFMYSSMRGPR